LTHGETPLGLDPNEVSLILKEVKEERSLAERIDRISSSFLGRPYVVCPLEGDARSPEVFKVSLAGFDCVTYVETVLALAQSGSLDEFVDGIREIRYAGGKVSWPSRNHYMIDWAKKNEERDIIRDLTEGRAAIEKTRTLGLIDGLPQKTVRFRCFPKKNLRAVESSIQTGDVILFVSTRKILDVFHMGFLIKGDKGIQLRHAARTAGRVIEQALTEFLDTHRMSGFILLRPL
jgi:Protein of unknown function (DUF1460)